jgi:L-alanine-DL-glutamate epimerase-like enolase superfamily enzyme
MAASCSTAASGTLVSKPTIAAVAAITVRVPVTIPTSISTRVLPHRDYVLVTVTDSDGASGTGYTYAGTSAGAWVAQAVNELLAPHALGAPARGISELSTRLAQEFLLVGRRGGLIRALSALDIALWDLLGQTTGVTLRGLLGSACTTVPAYASGGYYRPGDALQNIRDEVARQRARGFSDYKMKVGGATLREDEARVAAAREALGPAGRLALDANNAYGSVGEAMRAADAFAPHDIWWFEEPLLPDDVDGHAQLAARGTMPIATGEIEATAMGFAQLLRARAAHIHQTDACVCGGVSEWVKAAHAAAAFGVPVAPHWHHNLHAQLAAAVSNGLVVEYFALEEGVYNFEELVEPATRSVVRDGVIELSDLPGIGFRYDQEAVDRYTLAVA